MKIAFVNDSCERLGVEYISAFLKQQGHEVKLFIDLQLFNDENISIKYFAGFFDQKNKIIKDLLEFKPDLVGISVVTDFYPWALRMAKQIKENIDVPIIFGGIHPSSVPERVINNDCVDMVCVGEGEYPMLELIQSMEKGQIDYSIKNIWFKHNNQILQNEVRPLIADLDVLQIQDKEIFYSKSPHFSICYYIMTSRGCQYACSYCCHSFLKNKYKHKGIYLRRRGIKNIIAELKIAKTKYKPKYIRFFDDSLGADSQWLEAFTAVYKAEIGIPFICYMHPNDVKESAVKYLKSAGCCEIEIGVQTMNEKISYEVLNRYVSKDKIKQAIEIIQKEKISVVVDNILGLPGQEQQDILELVDYYNQYRVNRIYAFWLRYYPGVKITQWAKDQGILNSQQYEDIMDGKASRPFSRGGDTTNKDLTKLQGLFFLIAFSPKKLITWLAQKNRYKYLPVFLSPAILAAFTSLFSRAHNDKIVQAQVFVRYSTGLAQELKNLYQRSVYFLVKHVQKIFKIKV
jgi:anaerobic magnesium-protoporphyrin IX monomethyl ester cyclase